MDVKSDDITRFFSDVKTMFNPQKPVEAIQPVEVKHSNTTKLNKFNEDKLGSQRTNIIYLNTDCNLRCEYCYESDSRNGLPDQVNITPQEIDNFLLDVCEREKGRISTVVVMGGEPFLNFELIEYIVLKACSIVKEGKSIGWGLSIISNGTLFTDKLLTRYKKLLDIAAANKTYISQEVSFDGSGQFRRKWPNGSNSREHVEKGLDKLMEYDIPFRLSYTVHAGNYKNILKDCIYILEKYPKKYHDRMTIGYAYQDLDTVLGPQGSYKLRDEFIPYAKYLLDIYGVPLCGNTCGYCRECDQSTFVGNSYLSPTTGVTYDEKTTSHDFQQW